MWCIGIRAHNGEYEEPNTKTWIYLRIEDGAIVDNFPPTPVLTARTIAGGKIQLVCHVAESENLRNRPTTCKFFTNNGAGGAVDYVTEIDDATMLESNGDFVATINTGAYAETARVFGCIAYNSDSAASFKATEVTITPDATPPDAPEGVTFTAGRD